MFKVTLRVGMLVAAMAVATSCVNDLDRVPKYEVTSASVYADPANYKAVLARLYATLAVSGQQGPAGKPDISGIDEGTSNYMRLYWKLQELPTDEAKIAWNDATIQDINKITWTSSDGFITAMYNRIFYLISLSNEFIRETTDAKLAERSITGQAATDAKTYRAEARFLRAMAYFHAIDMFGTVPFVTEADAPGSFLPRQATRQELFTYVESELKAIETELAAPGAAEYGRADRAAAQAILARLYLNAQVYTSTAKYSEAITYAKKVIDSGVYKLEPTYQNLFTADNNLSKEIIFPITFDGTRTQTYGGMTFLVHAQVGGSMNVSSYGVNGGWAGIRSTQKLADVFPDATAAADKRGVFYTDGQQRDLNDLGTFTDGYAITKYKNVTSTGKPGSDQQFVDTDFPLIRLADMYLTYAEAVLRGGTGGDQATAISYVNLLRTRAKAAAVSSINLDFILAERARELYWEGYRRTDLIRYERFVTGTYLWPWKGGVKEGRAVDVRFNLYPIPATDLVANPTLRQNGSGY
ncbi:RagB/SusD family nutrient uptake outer membrane protein [Fibrella forsythiae]|uniref:RagB/SusD family nutrient uptake outer membrane protein n=1 Tax=Fibrella forsythiae TaxID=2817061 RepID=A0ABS3JC92_9BACT|nr:RagB/SusD family nutrient uptake outer membrane protein [Fibrella forsythiae]MBO0947615.1 RagB/SusD family nutrient uptake outer membrane protein [Fibrella forsythiae]